MTLYGPRPACPARSPDAVAPGAGLRTRDEAGCTGGDSPGLIGIAVVYQGMTRERRTQIITLAALVVAGAIALARFPRSKPPAGPADAVYAVMDAARAGNVKAYLECYAGGMRSSLEQAARESNEGAFARYLRETNATIKGMAVSEPQAAGDREASVRVEYVYQDRNEVQVMHLEKTERGWKITAVEGTARVKTLVPYGTPVQ